MAPFVYDKGPAYASGMRDGDCVVAVDGVPVKDVQDFMRAVAALIPGKAIAIAIRGKSPLAVMPVERSPEQVTAFCIAHEHLQTQLIAQDFLTGKDLFVRRQGSWSVGEVRNALGATGPAQVSRHDKCGGGETLTTEDTPDSVVLVGTVSVLFHVGHHRPLKTKARR